MKFLKTAKLFDLKNLTESLKYVLEGKINQNNICFYYAVIKQYNKKNIQNYILNYLQKYFCFATENNHHLYFDFELIKEILLSSNLKITSEIEVVNAADAWIKYDIEKEAFLL